MYLEVFATAYLALDSEREWLANIPWSAIVRWGDWYELDSDLVEDLVYFIRQIDNAVLVDRKRKTEAESKRSNGQPR